MAAAPDWLVSKAAIDAGLAAAPRPFFELMKAGSMRAGLYAPRGTDPQQPHAQDELYIIASGAGTFVRAAERRPFGPGDVIFVEAGVPHRFEEFSDDFFTWVVFWGPEGGESA